MTKDIATLSLESEPSGALVSLEGKPLGKTPLRAVLVPSKKSTLSLTYGKGYKEKLLVLDSEKKISLTGENKVLLEKNYHRVLLALLKKGKTTQAETLLEKIPVSHSDYLESLRTMGDLYFKSNDWKKAGSFYETIYEKSDKKQTPENHLANVFLNRLICRIQNDLLKETPEKPLFSKTFAELVALEEYVQKSTDSEERGALVTVKYYKAFVRQIEKIAPLELKSLWLEYLDLAGKDQDLAHVSSAKKYYQSLLSTGSLAEKSEQIKTEAPEVKI